MVQTSLRGNPLIAGFLGILVTGLGHLYLRRWLRALGWLGVTFIVSVLFVPESTATAITSGAPLETSVLLSFLPVLLVEGASAVDAYRIAKHSTTRTAETQPDLSGEADQWDSTVTCPVCGKETDSELGFCHWCTSELEVQPDTEPRGGNDEKST